MKEENRQNVKSREGKALKELKLWKLENERTE
jgi:hypothetical protein